MRKDKIQIVGKTLRCCEYTFDIPCMVKLKVLKRYHDLLITLVSCFTLYDVHIKLYVPKKEEADFALELLVNGEYSTIK